MTDHMTLGYVIALGEARSCLAALADAAATFDESVHYDRLLLALDLIHEDYQGCDPVGGAQDELLDRLEAAVDEIHRLG